MDSSQIIIFLYVCIQGVIVSFVAILALQTITKVVNKCKIDVSNLEIFKLWLQTSWKMRNIYGCIVVHVFDFATDLLVVRSWFMKEDEKHEDIEHIDAKVMAWCSICVLLFHRSVSSLAMLIMSDYNWKHCILQFLDLLLFIEIFESHAKLMESITSLDDISMKSTSINTTSTIHTSRSKSSSLLTIDIDPNCKSIRSIHQLQLDKQASDLTLNSGPTLHLSTRNSCSSVQSSSSLDHHHHRLHKYSFSDDYELDEKSPLQQLSKEASNMDIGVPSLSPSRSRYKYEYKYRIKVNNDAIDSSLRFKYLRSLEALFEAAPQAVIQLVFIMRTQQIEFVFITSILQSIVSMTNSILNQDNAYMIHPKWDSYKQKVPIPHMNFLKHAFFRACEITSRIGLFSIFWTVVGGFYVIVLLIPWELSFPLIYDLYMYYNHRLSWNEFFLSVNITISLPPEWIFEMKTFTDDDLQALSQKTKTITKQFKKFNFIIKFILGLILSPLAFLVAVAITLSLVIGCVFCYPVGEQGCYFYTSLRVSVSLLEWIVIMLFGMYVDYYDNGYLFKQKHCLYEFIATVICFFIYSFAYPLLMPDIRLTDNIIIRSNEGYAHLGNKDELIKKWQKFRMEKLNGEEIIKEYFSGTNLEKIEKETRSIENAIEEVNLFIKSVKCTINNIAKFFYYDIGLRMLNKSNEDQEKASVLVDQIETQLNLNEFDKIKEKLIPDVRCIINSELWKHVQMDTVKMSDIVKYIIQKYSNYSETLKTLRKNIIDIHSPEFDAEIESMILSMIENNAKTAIMHELKENVGVERYKEKNYLATFNGLFELVTMKLNQHKTVVESDNKLMSLICNINSEWSRVDRIETSKQIKVNSEQIECILDHFRLVKGIDIICKKLKCDTNNIEKIDNQMDCLKIAIRDWKSEYEGLRCLKKKKDNISIEARQKILLKHFKPLSLNNKNKIINWKTMEEDIERIESAVMESHRFDGNTHVIKDFKNIKLVYIQMIENFWGHCVYYARKNEQCKTVEWLLEHGAKDTQHEITTVMLSGSVTRNAEEEMENSIL